MMLDDYLCFFMDSRYAPIFFLTSGEVRVLTW